MADFTLQVQSSPSPQLVWTAGPSSLTEFFNTDTASFSVELDTSQISGHSAAWDGSVPVLWSYNLIGQAGQVVSSPAPPPGYSVEFEGTNGNTLVINMTNDASELQPFICGFQLHVDYDDGVLLTSPDPTIVNIDPTGPGVEPIGNSLA